MVKIPVSQSHGKGRAFPRLRLRKLAKSSSGPCVDVDNVCKN